VNDAVRVSTEGLLTTAELAARRDFTLGLAIVSPSSRTIAGPGGTTDIEPRVMQVLVVLADAAGSVVTRDTLFNRCWGGVFVGDDSLNRAVVSVRKLAGDIAGGSFEIETIPRTGYRLAGAVPEPVQSDEGNAEPRLSRRGVIAGGVAAAAVLGSVAWWGSNRWRETRFDTLMAEGDEAFRNGRAFGGSGMRSKRNPGMIHLYEEATGLRPDSARAWGLLAYFKSREAEDSTATDSPRLTTNAQAAIQRALAIDPKEPNARIGLFLLEGRTLDWMARDSQLRDILQTDPANLLAMSELMQLLQATGLTRESWTWNERLLHASPFARPFLVVRAMKLWILGRIRDSDSVIDRVRGLWPDYAFGFTIRFLLFALTGRPSAALAMLDSAPEKFGGADRVKMWRTALGALETRARPAIDAARNACLDMARTVPEKANDMVMVLCALGETEAAFDVTEGFLLWRGKVVSTGQANGKALDDYDRRMTQWLFTPPVAPMWTDLRFARLCDEFGLSAYWRARNVRPPYLPIERGSVG
jgi:DNA-binding winged helix-turn-helix (wHTH) protein